MTAVSYPLYKYERIYHKKYGLVAGVDEAGRGPLAGPVVVAAVILDINKPIAGIDDSKKLTEKKRELLYDIIVSEALSYSLIEVSHQRIDKINILQAVLEGMRIAVETLDVKPQICLFDGNKTPHDYKFKAQAVIKGDAKIASIAAASILAKVHRDRIMKQYDILYPQYGFAKHKGYPTKLHFETIKTYGPCPIHRLSYAPLQQINSIGS